MLAPPPRGNPGSATVNILLDTMYLQIQSVQTLPELGESVSLLIMINSITPHNLVLFCILGRAQRMRKMFGDEMGNFLMIL